MKAIGVVLIAMAAVVAVVPMLTDCQSQGKSITLADGRTIPMKCHWTGVAELALAVPLLLVGGFLAIGRRRETLRALSIMGGVLGLFVVLLPTQLIGVCANPDMLCNSTMKPTLILMGIVTIAASLVGLVMAQRKAEPALGA